MSRAHKFYWRIKIHLDRYKVRSLPSQELEFRVSEEQPGRRWREFVGRETEQRPIALRNIPRQSRAAGSRLLRAWRLATDLGRRLECVRLRLVSGADFLDCDNTHQP